MPAHDELPPEILHADRVDPRTGLAPGEWQPQTEEDRRLAKVRERERWVTAVSEPPPSR